MDAIVSGPGAGELFSGDQRDLRVKANRPELDFLEFDVPSDFDVWEVK